jgi:DNA-binding IclR family transcriptional regulator
MFQIVGSEYRSVEQHSGIGVLDKAVTVLRTVAVSPCGLAELCARTGLPRATAHRLAVGLEAHRLLSRGGDGRWRPGPALRELGEGALDPLLDAAAIILPRLRDVTGESVQLYRRDGMVRVCVATAEPHSGLRDTVPVGARLAMTAGSGAKVLAAWADPATQSAVLDEAVFNEQTLMEIRKRGWAQSVAEREPGVASVSAPVRDPTGTVVAAVSVSGPVERIGRRPGVRWATDLLAAAEALHNRL